MRQTTANIELEVTNINLKRFFGLAARHSPAGQAGKDLFPQRLGELIQLPADGGFMNPQHAGDLGQSTSIQIISSEDGAILRGELSKHFVRRLLQTTVGNWRGLGFWGRELQAFFGFLLETDQALRSPVTVEN